MRIRGVRVKSKANKVQKINRTMIKNQEVRHKNLAILSHRYQIPPSPDLLVKDPRKPKIA